MTFDQIYDQSIKKIGNTYHMQLPTHYFFFFVEANTVINKISKNNVNEKFLDELSFNFVLFF